MPLTPLEEAQEMVRARVPLLAVVEVPAAEAAGLVTAEAVLAPEAVPPFDNTAVDGFAVRAADTSVAPARLAVVGTVSAGEAPGVAVGPVTAVRIMTGAPLPEGADAVVMVEDTRVESGAGGDADEVVVLQRSVEPGAHVRRRGDDLHPGDVAIPEGMVLRAAHVGLLATVNRPTVRVRRRPVVGVVSTGDELVTDGSALLPGQIRESNRPMLLALCAQAGFEAVDLGVLRDDEAVIEAALLDAAARCDVVLTSGGVSMGDFDWVKAVLGRLGEMTWLQVAIKPAKPFAFGLLDGTPVFGLPGNPVSSMVSFELLARPAIRTMMGHPRPHRLRVPATAPDGLRRRRDGKVHFVRVTVEPVQGASVQGPGGQGVGAGGGLAVRPTGGQGSHQLAASAAADGLAVVPDGDGVAPGGEVEVMLLSP